MRSEEKFEENFARILRQNGGNTLNLLQEIFPLRQVVAGVRKEREESW